MAPLLLGSGGGRRRGKGCSQRGVEGGVQQATEGVTMVIWHPNVAVRDLGYRKREVNQRLRPEKQQIPPHSKVLAELCGSKLHHEVTSVSVQINDDFQKKKKYRSFAACHPLPTFLWLPPSAMCGCVKGKMQKKHKRKKEIVMTTRGGKWIVISFTSHRVMK